METSECSATTTVANQLGADSSFTDDGSNNPKRGGWGNHFGRVIARRWDERIGRRLKLRDLHISMAVAERGTMARAASSLAMSQPAVSRAIGDMEHTLGLRLLDRSRKGVEPTAYGRALIRRGMAVFDELREGVKELQFLA